MHFKMIYVLVSVLVAVIKSCDKQLRKRFYFSSLFKDPSWKRSQVAGLEIASHMTSAGRNTKHAAAYFFLHLYSPGP